MSAKVQTLLLENYLKTLRLPTMLREHATLARQCAEPPRGCPADYSSYLERPRGRPAGREVTVREEKALCRRLASAGFPTVKELADFDFAAVPKLSKRRVLDLAGGKLIEEKSNVVFVGSPGVGKSHLAIGLGRAASRLGYRVKFFTASGLVNEYLEAREERRVLRLESSLRRLDLVVVDELGYLPLERRGAEHLFGFFSLCYEQTSLLVTTNLPFSEWPQTLAGDERLAGALLDRLTHRIDVVEILGESYRLRSSLKSKQTSKSPTSKDAATKSTTKSKQG